MTGAGASEPLSTRLWRRYGAQALGMFEDIREDPRQGKVPIEHTEYLRCDLKQARRRKMVTRLEREE